jgi:predicted ATPase
MGGTGKTRLSLEVARALVEPLSGAVWFVPLADISEAMLIPAAIADTLGLPRSGNADPLDQVVEALSRQPSLLVVDNFEQVVEAGAALVQTLLERVPSLTLLVTSRQVLGLSSEREMAVSLLPTPQGANTPERLSLCESVRLFIDRAQSVRPDFQVTGHNAPALAELCARLEGIPLALELAAARAQVLTPAQMLLQVERRFDFLVSRKKDVMARHRTLRGAVGWSYSLLSPPLRRFFCHLSVFRGGWSSAAAEVVCEEPLALDLLAQLRECSFVLVTEEADVMRFRMLECLREFAAELLPEDEAQEVARRHARYFTGLAEEAETYLNGPQQTEWYARLEVEHDNFRAALNFCSQDENLQSEAAALRLAGALYRFWLVRGYYTEGRQWLADTLASPIAQAHTPARAKALNAAGGMARVQSDYAAARSLHEESLELCQELGDKLGIANSFGYLGIVASIQNDYAASRSMFEESLVLFRELENKGGIANSLMNLGDVAKQQGDYAAARLLIEQSLTLYRELGDKLCITISLGNLGSVAQEQGDYAAARSLYEESLAIKKELGNKGGIANSLMNLGLVALGQDDYAAARTLFEEGLALSRELRDKLKIAISLGNIGIVAHAQGDYAAAHTLFEEGLALCRELGDKLGVAYSLEGLAAVALVQEQPARAPLLWGAAEALREALGTPHTPNDLGLYEENVAEARATMGEEAFATAWAAGRAMPLEQIVKYALEECGGAELREDGSIPGNPCGVIREVR